MVKVREAWSVSVRGVEKVKHELATEQQQPNNSPTTARWFPWWLRCGSKNLPASLETRVQPLGWEDPLEKGMATHSSNLAWRIPRTEETDGKELDTTEQVTLPLSQQQQYRTVSEMRWIPHMNGVSFLDEGAWKVFLIINIVSFINISLIQLLFIY